MKKNVMDKIVSKTKKPISKDDICEGLRKLGVCSGDTILVHSSLSSFGFVIGAEVALYEALKETVGKNGTIVVASQSADNTDPTNWLNPAVPDEWLNEIKEKMPEYNSLCYNTMNMGRLVNMVLQDKKSTRSNHPNSSFAAVGKNARKICKVHDLQPAFGRNTPLGYLYKNGAKVLLLGVGYYNSTCFHLSEVLSNKNKTEKNGARFNGKWVDYIDFEYINDDFDSLGFAMEEEIEVKKMVIGLAECKCFNLHDAVDYGKKWILRNRS